MTLTRRVILSAAAVAIVMAGQVLSSSIPKRQLDPSDPVGPAEDPDETCGFEGNSDMYGVGIRIGIYLQSGSVALATLFSQTALQEELAFANGLFQLAFTVGLIYMTVTSPEFQAVEAAIVVLLSVVSNFSAPFAVKRPESSDSSEMQYFMQHRVFPVCRTITEFVLFGYSAWFWFTGLDKLSRAPCTGYAFFFARVDLYGWFRTLGRIYIICEILTQAGVYGAALVRRCKDGNEGQYDEKKPEGWGKAWIIFLGINRFVVLGFILLSVECMIRWNQIREVQDLGKVGQLIAFLVGFGSIVNLAVKWGKKQD